MAASAASRPQTGRINLHDPSDYPIVLGDSFKNESTSTSRYLRLRYNWEPENGFTDQKGTLKRSNGQVQLSYKDEKTGSTKYDYNANAVANAGDSSDDQSTAQLALVFDSTKSAFVLERITKSYDLNLISAHGQSKSEVRQHTRIPSTEYNGPLSQTNRAKAGPEKDEDEADPSNPFDYRHFLAEAKENAEKAAQPTGSRTPLAGSRTPMSGVSSPSLGAARFLTAGTPQFRPTPTSAPLPKKAPASKPVISVPSKRQPAAKRKVTAPKPRATQPLSNEVVHDSSDEDTQDTITLPTSQPSRPKEPGRKRNDSSGSTAGSAALVIDDGGLEFDLGSPPPETKRKTMLDLDAFRSQTHTPTLGFSSNRPPPLDSHGDIEMRDASEDEREDEEDDDEDDERNNNADSDMDEDVEEFELGSPRSKRADEGKDDLGKAPSPPTPLPPPPAYDDDEDFLAAELEAALGEDDPSTNVADEDESDISEEE